MTCADKCPSYNQVQGSRFRTPEHLEREVNNIFLVRSGLKKNDHNIK